MGEVMTTKETLHQLVDQLPDKADVAAHVECLLQAVIATETGPNAEDRAWLDAALTPPLEPYDWGPEGPQKGSPVTYIPGKGFFSEGKS